MGIVEIGGGASHRMPLTLVYAWYREPTVMLEIMLETLKGVRSLINI